MLSDSLVTPFDWTCLGREQADNPSECTFWTGRQGQMSVQYFRPGSDVSYQPHTHSEYTIIVCLAGEVFIRQLGVEQVIGPGEVLIGNHGAEHSSRYQSSNGQACEAVSVALDRRLFAALTKDFRRAPAGDDVCSAFLGKVHGAPLRDAAQGIAHELRYKPAGHHLLVETHAIRLLMETMRVWPASGVGEMEASSTPRLPRRDFVRAYEFMRWCRKDGFRLQRLCRFLGSSEERFTRLFLASTNQTPASFYNRLLLDRARERLRNPRLSIKEIGFELGYKTSSHFIVAFRREHGVSPEEYRQRSAVRELRIGFVKTRPQPGAVECRADGAAGRLRIVCAGA